MRLKGTVFAYGLPPIHGRISADRQAFFGCLEKQPGLSRRDECQALKCNRTIGMEGIHVLDGARIQLALTDQQDPRGTFILCTIWSGEKQEQVTVRQVPVGHCPSLAAGTRHECQEQAAQQPDTCEDAHFFVPLHDGNSRSGAKFQIRSLWAFRFKTSLRPSLLPVQEANVPLLKRSHDQQQGSSSSAQLCEPPHVQQSGTHGHKGESPHAHWGSGLACTLGVTRCPLCTRDLVRGPGAFAQRCCSTFASRRTRTTPM